MRGTFFNLLFEQMKSDKTLFLLAADMGLGLIERFQEEYPDRVLNIGIAEANMAGIAAGLCNAGFRPVCYTISNFLVERSFEQIRNDVCLHEYPVIFVGTTTGYDNGKLGPTHQAIEDIGCMKILPGMHIYSPATTCSVRGVFGELMGLDKPAYVRIGKGSYKLDSPITSVNSMVKNVPESNILVITHGTTMDYCLKASREVPFSLYCMNRINPVKNEEIEQVIRNYEKIVVVEDHFRDSGLYDSLCRSIMEIGQGAKCIIPVAPPSVYESVIGDRDFFAQRYGYNPEGIINKLQSII